MIVDNFVELMGFLNLKFQKENNQKKFKKESWEGEYSHVISIFQKVLKHHPFSIR